MNHSFTPDDYAIAVAESSVARYVYTPYVQGILEARPVTSVLDLHCNEGFFSRLAVAAGAQYVVGVEQCPAMLERGIQISEAAGLGIEFRQGDPSTLRLEQSFSAVFAFWLTSRLATRNHLQELAETLFYHTSPDGYSYLLAIDCAQYAKIQHNPQTPDDCYGKKIKTASNLQEGSPFELTIEVSEIAVHFTDYCWSPQTVATCLQEAGFASVNVLYPPISEAGMEARGDDYWASYRAAPFVVAIEAHRAP